MKKHFHFRHPIAWLKDICSGGHYDKTWGCNKLRRAARNAGMPVKSFKRYLKQKARTEREERALA